MFSKVHNTEIPTWTPNGPLILRVDSPKLITGLALQNGEVWLRLISALVPLSFMGRLGRKKGIGPLGVQHVPSSLQGRAHNSRKPTKAYLESPSDPNQKWVNDHHFSRFRRRLQVEALYLAPKDPEGFNQFPSTCGAIRVFNKVFGVSFKFETWGG